MSQKSSGQPFAFWYGASEPHGPHEDGSGIRERYSIDELQLTPNFTETSDQVKSDLLDYFVEIEWFDTHLGQMIEILSERGEYNPEYLSEIPPEIFVSELYFKALDKKRKPQEQPGSPDCIERAA